MTPFDLAEPKTLREAVELLDPDDPTVRPIAGGTALMLMMKAGVFRPARLVSLRGSRRRIPRSSRRRRRPADRRDDDACRARALGGGARHAAGDHPHAADAVQRARAQRRDRRRRTSRMAIRTWICRRC